MSPRLLLDRLIEFEQRVHRLYCTFGDRASLPAEVRFFWRSMAEDERHHLAILERSAALLDMVDAPLEVSEAVLVGIEEKIAAAEAAVQRADLSLDEALGHALTLEGPEISSLDHAWFQGFRPLVGSLLQAIAPEAKAHIRRLVEAVPTFSTNKALHHQAVLLWSAYQAGRLSQATTNVS